jgi:hypothetical protein
MARLTYMNIRRGQHGLYLADIERGTFFDQR